MASDDPLDQLSTANLGQPIVHSIRHSFPIISRFDPRFPFTAPETAATPVSESSGCRAAEPSGRRAAGPPAGR